MLTTTYAECHIKDPHAECHYAECLYAECRGAISSTCHAVASHRGQYHKTFYDRN